ncbi:MAG: YicC family protein [Limnobacter sp.]|nr:YicC family protein [Limnobacter sp.]
MSNPDKASPPIYSMTGYAHVQSTSSAGTLTLELRSVNSRFLDLHFRMVDELRFTESMIREKLAARIARGKVECRISWGKPQTGSDLPPVNTERVKALAHAEASLQKHMPQLRTFSTADVLAFPGVLAENATSQDDLHTEIAHLAEQALEALLAARAREGLALKHTLLQKIEAMQVILALLEPQLPEFVAAFEAKVRDRLSEAFNKVLADKPESTLLSPADIEERIKSEVALHSVRVDVQEELDRLKTHFVEVQRVLNKGGVAGKRLDFITQELNREANTLGSKANAVAQTQSAIELKVLIEQFREQIQNLE